MTNESSTITDDAAESDAATAHEVVAAAEPSAVKWHARNNHGQTNFDRYFVPLLVPLTSVVGIIFFVVNVSRALISGTPTIALVVASVITVAILVAASCLAAASKMRSQTITVFSCVSMMIVMGIGLISVGHAQEKKEAAAVACDPATSKLSIVTTGALKFDSEYAAEAGCVDILYSGPVGLHNLTFTSENKPPGPVLLSGTAGKDEFAYMLEAGEYTVKCTVPGHEAMVAAIVVK